MSTSPYGILLILCLSMILFIWGKWRYDLIAVLALLAAVAIGAVPFDHLYDGLSNHAVITVAAVMVISYTIAQSGLLNQLIRQSDWFTKSTTLHVASFSLISAILSAFMNNVGALSLMMPIAIESAHKHQRSPALLLLPIALSSALGGLTTLIGTPPNLLIADFRSLHTGEPFYLFDYSPVGIPVACLGIALIATLLWRLIPAARHAIQPTTDLLEQKAIFHLQVSQKTCQLHPTLGSLQQACEANLTITTLIRDGQRMTPLPLTDLHPEDILVITAQPKALESLLNNNPLGLITEQRAQHNDLTPHPIHLLEVVLTQASELCNQTADYLPKLFDDVEVIAISRSGQTITRNTHPNLTYQPGDLLLLQGELHTLTRITRTLNLIALDTPHPVGSLQKKIAPLLIFVTAIIASSLRLIPTSMSFTLVVMLFIVFKFITLRKVYESIDWSVIILLSAMIPVGAALETTGGSDLLAKLLLSHAAHHPALYSVVIVLVVTMTLSDCINNAATTILMAPIAITIANALHTSIDPFLMAVALGASCSFLTPVGHQNNILVMGPGGYRFQDYIRIGLPLEILVILLGVPLILFFFPL